MQIHRIMQKTDQRAGFTLVETALAMLVAAVGLTAVIALMPAAMDQGKKAADETYAAFFADTVFNSYHVAVATVITNVASPSADRNYVVRWSNLENYKTIPPVTVGGRDMFWKDSADMAVIADGNMRTQLFVAASTKEKFPSGSLQDIGDQYDHAFRYRLTMTDVSVSNVVTRRRLLALEVWPGEYGSTNNPYRFATEIFQYGFNN